MARNLDELFPGSLQLLRKLDVLWSFLQQLRQEFPSFDKRSRAKIGSIQEEQIKGVVDERDLHTHTVRLKELERNLPFWSSATILPSMMKSAFSVLKASINMG